MATPAADACQTRVVTRPEAAGNPLNIDPDWLEHQYCDDVDFADQSVWFDKNTNNLYFRFHHLPEHPLVGVSPTIEYRVLADLDESPIEVLRTDALEQILAEIIIT